MIGRRDKGEIDAVDILEKEEERLAGAGGAAAIDAPRGGMPPGAKGALLVGSAVVVMIALTLGVQAVKRNHATPAAAEKKDEAQVGVINTSFKPTPVDAVALGPDGQPLAAGDGSLIEGEPIEPLDVTGAVASSQPAPGQVPAMAPTTAAGGGAYPQSAGAPQPREPTPAELVHLRRLQGGLGNREVPAQASRAAASDTGEERESGELGQALRPLRLNAQQASQLGDRNYLLTQGAMIDCVLQTKMVSSVPGMVSCYTTRDVYSANGRVVLVDKGSKVVGFYQGGLRQGQARIFVQWSRVETTKGVIINLDSPGTGPLGEGGVDGKIDTHFRQRFGGAILLSLVDDLGDYFANRNNGGQQVQFSNSGDAAKELARVTLENSINIPPTLVKNQGERLSIFVARDLDFRSVYGLSRR